MEQFSKVFPYLVSLCLISETFSVCWKSTCHVFGANSLPGPLCLDNRALTGYELYAVKVEGFLQCFDSCLVECRCMSFNFKKGPLQDGRFQCQLNFERLGDINATAMLEKPGYSYHDIETTVSKSTRTRPKR